MTSEPVAWGAVLTGTVTAVIAVLTAFNVWHAPTDAQLAAVGGAETALIAVVAFFVRSKVTPV